MRIHKMLALTAVLALSGTACADLAVQNLNAPDRDRAISSPLDVQNLIAGAFVNWWSTAHHSYPGSPLSTAADAHSSSWGNWGMRDSGWEPRKAFDNDPSYSFNNLAETPWGNSYASLAGVRDGLLAIRDGGITIDDPPGSGIDVTDRAQAFGAFVQAMSLSHIALFFDQGFVVDEDTDLETASFEPYTAVWAAALAKFESAISQAQGKSWTIPPLWIGQENAPAWSSDRFVSMMKAYRARYATQVARNEADRAAVNWSQVLSDTQGGSIVGGDYWGYYDGDNSFWGRDKLHGCCSTGWARLDMRTAGVADETGQWADWINTEAANRQPFDIVTRDTRITAPGDPQEDGTHTRYLGNSPFPADRGTYHYSNYMWWGPDHRLMAVSGRVGNYIEMTDREMRFLAAEAQYNMGNNGPMMDLVNEGRVRSGLPPFTTTSNPDSYPACVPHPVRPSTANTCGDLWEAYKYEKRIELFHHGLGTEYWDDRGWGDLVQDTWQQLPVPGSELLLLLQDIYSFGGPGGTSSAPNLLNDFSPEALKIKREALDRFREMTMESIEPGVVR